MEDKELEELNEAEREAKQNYEDALELLQICQRERAADPCEITLDALIKARQHIKRTLSLWETARYHFQEYWDDSYGIDG